MSNIIAKVIKNHLQTEANIFRYPADHTASMMLRNNV